MLAFLYLASKRKINIASYTDEAVGFMEPTDKGKLWVSTVILRPTIVFGGQKPGAETIEALHHEAHEECYIANSVKTNIPVQDKA